MAFCSDQAFPLLSHLRGVGFHESTLGGTLNGLRIGERRGVDTAPAWHSKSVFELKNLYREKFLGFLQESKQRLSESVQILTFR